MENIFQRRKEVRGGEEQWLKEERGNRCVRNWNKKECVKSVIGK